MEQDLSRNRRHGIVSWQCHSTTIRESILEITEKGFKSLSIRLRFGAVKNRVQQHSSYRCLPVPTGILAFLVIWTKH